MFLTSYSSSAASKTPEYAFSLTTYNDKVSYKAMLKVEYLGETHYIYKRCYLH